MIRRFAALLMLLVLAPAPSRADDPRVEALERKVDALAQELDALRLGIAPAETTAALVGRAGLGPAAGKVYGGRRGVSLGGYGEGVLTRVDAERQDGVRAGGGTTFDFVRAVLYVGYKFDDQLLLNSEIELEHAGVRDEAEVAVDPASGAGAAELSGEASLEFAYLEWLRSPAFGLRAGLLLVPIGLTNEVHEPPVTIAARRPEVERVVIPTTWSAGGLGAQGIALGTLAWRAYVLEGLNAGHFDAGSGIREGRQSGSQAVTTHPGFVGRLDWSGPLGLSVGGSAYTGDAWQEAQPEAGRIRARVTLVDAHARWAWRGLDVRGLYADGRIPDAGPVSDALGLTGDERLGRGFFGGYVEAGYDVLSQWAPQSGYGLAPYLRHEVWDTQNHVDGVGAENPANHHTATTAGIGFRPHPQVVVKADHEWRRNHAHTENDRWNLAVGYLF